jgi:hypothetical protein
MGNSTHGDSAVGDNVHYEPRDHQMSLSDVSQLTTQVRASPNNDEEEDAKMTCCQDHMSLEAEHFLQPTTQPPMEQWPTEAPEVSNTKENRSLEGQYETNQAASDDKDMGINLTREQMEVGRNDEEEFVPNADINKEMDIREEDKPLETDDASGDDDNEEAVNEPYTEPGDELTMQHDKRVYVSPIGVTASEGHDEVRIDYKHDNSTSWLC